MGGYRTLKIVGTPLQAITGQIRVNDSWLAALGLSFFLAGCTQGYYFGDVGLAIPSFSFKDPSLRKQANETEDKSSIASTILEDTKKVSIGHKIEENFGTVGTTLKSTVHYQIVDAEKDAQLFSVDQEGFISFRDISDRDFEKRSSYDVVLRVLADGKSKDYSIKIYLENINEEPEFSGETSYMVLENTLVGQTVFTALAQDPEGETLHYELAQGGEAFQLEADGRIAWKIVPNYESVQKYVVEIVASAGGQQKSQFYEILVLDENEAPIFDLGSTSTIAVDENTEVLAWMVVIRAEDEEKTPLGYSKGGGADDDAFVINQATGEVMFISSPDYEVQQNYELIVSASDGTASNDMQHRLLVDVNDINENPVFTNLDTRREVMENVLLVGDSVHRFEAQDPEMQNITYTLGGSDAGKFTLSATTAVLELATLLDFESPSDSDNDNAYEVTVTASDGVSSQTLDFTLLINNANEALLFDAVVTPTYDAGTMTFTIEENITAVGVITAMDTDVKEVRYGKEGADAAAFNVDAVTGAISFVTAPNFETKPVYDITITAMTADETERLALMVAITNVNEALVFDRVTVGTYNETSMTFTIDENTTSVGTLTATDSDGKTVRYGKEGVDAAVFDVNAATGVINFVATPDFEAKASYEITIVAMTTDETERLALMVSVDDVNEAPNLTAVSKGVTWQKGITGVTYDVSPLFTDQDTGDILTYGVMGVLPAWLELVGSNLSIKAGYAVGLSDPSMSSNPFAENIIIDLTVMDTAGLSEITPFTFMLTEAANNSLPNLAGSPVTLMVLEEYAGGILYKFHGEDMDVFDTITYSLAPSSDNPGYFVLDDDGTLRIEEITVVMLPKKPNFEIPDDAGLDGMYSLVIVAMSRGDEVRHNVEVTIENKNDEQTITGGTIFNVDGNNAGNIATFMLTDEDAGSVFTYSLAGSGKDIFMLTNNAMGEGELSIETALLDDLLERGSTAWTFDVIATSTLGAEKHQIAEEIMINLQPLNSIPEWSGPRRTIETVEFVEGVKNERWYLPHDWVWDKDSSIGENFSYTISLQTTGSRWLRYDIAERRIETVAVFAGGVTGEVAVPSITGGIYSNYVGMLTIKDVLGGVFNQDFLIDVRGGTSTTPVFDMASYSFTVDENTTAIGMVSATDVDGDNIDYSIVYVNDTNKVHRLFYVDLAGNIVAHKGLDYERKSTYDFEIRAQGGAKSVVSSVNIMVNDLADPPVFNNTSENFYTIEGTYATFDATVASFGKTAVYTLQGDDEALFSLNTAGRVFLKNPLDFETPLDMDADNIYSIEVIARFDMETETSMKTINFHILDRNDEVPMLVTAIADVTTMQGDTDFRFEIPRNAFTDSDVGDVLSYQYGFTGASWLQDVGGGLLYAPYIPDSATTVTVMVTVSDATGKIATTDFDINVLVASVDEGIADFSLFFVMATEDWDI